MSDRCYDDRFAEFSAALVSIDERDKRIAELEDELAGSRTRLAAVERERDEALAKADLYAKDWYAAKSEFGTARAKLTKRIAELEEALRRIVSLLLSDSSLIIAIEAVQNLINNSPNLVSSTNGND